MVSVSLMFSISQIQITLQNNEQKEKKKLWKYNKQKSHWMRWKRFNNQLINKKRAYKMKTHNSRKSICKNRRQYRY